MARRRLSNIDLKTEESEIDLTPMLDVVFIMLIFFIVTASFVRETGLDVNRPEQDDRPQVVQERGAILVILDDTNQIWIDGLIIDPRAVQANIGRLYAEDSSRPVVIQADPRSSAELLVGIMDSSRQAGATNISIAAGAN